jgi:hypothetical protein
VKIDGIFEVLTATAAAYDADGASIVPSLAASAGAISLWVSRSSKRPAIKLDPIRNFTEAQKRIALERAGGRCEAVILDPLARWLNGRCRTRRRLVVSHFVPHSAGGPTDTDNACCLCEFHAASKLDSTPPEERLRFTKAGSFLLVPEAEWRRLGCPSRL